MAQSNVLSTLQHVTDIKLGKLAHRQQAFEEHKARLVREAEAKATLGAQTLVLVQDAIERDSADAALGFSPAMLKHFLQQSIHDPSISEAQIEQWNRCLRHALDCQSHRYQITSLFGQLVTEYLKNPNSANTAAQPSSAEDFEQVGREEMHQQRKQWEYYAFRLRQTSEEAITEYLEGLFDVNNARTVGQNPLDTLRQFTADFEMPRMTAKDVGVCIKTLLNADLFAGDKRKALMSMQPMESLCSEISDCLNSDLDFISEWTWDKTPILLFQRRQLNGKYRVYMDEEIYQAILIQYIGLQWASHFKEHFKIFQKSKAWSYAVAEQMTPKQQERREYFLQEKEDTASLHQKRKKLFQDTYFCTQLPDHPLLYQAGGYGRDEDASEDWDNLDVLFNPGALADVRQLILRQVATESIISTKLHGEFTVLQSDFKWFGPSLPHSTINAVLRFLRVPEKWLVLFNKFLQVPLAFVQDGEQGATQKRQSGVPMSHALSDMMGEAVLFTLDYAVNRRTKGANLIRFYDDLWVWGSRDHCEKGWAALNEFSKVMGLELNLEKTGTVIVQDQSKPMSPRTISKTLPPGKVTWGFLCLAESGKWEIDQTNVDKHIEELRRQLGACRSIMAFVSAYNVYVGRFMLNNFGKPAECLGRPHIEDAIKTISRVNSEVFKETKGNPAAYLRRIISSKFHVKGHLPDGFFYLPQAIGGLGLQNPLLALQLKWRQAKEEQPGKIIDTFLKSEENEWSNMKERFEVARNGRGYGKRPSSVAENEGFMPLEEYMRFLELRSGALRAQFEAMMAEVETSVIASDVSAELRGCSHGVRSLQSHAMKAALQLYGHGVLEYCGGLQLGEQEMLPTGLLDVLQSEKFRWQG